MSTTQNLLATPEFIVRHFEAYIGVWEWLRDPELYIRAAHEYDEYNSVSSGWPDSVPETVEEKVSWIKTPLEQAVRIGTLVLRSQGETNLATSAQYSINLRHLLKANYDKANETAKYDYEVLPEFPFTAMTVLRGILSYPNRQKTWDNIAKLIPDS